MKKFFTYTLFFLNARTIAFITKFVIDIVTNNSGVKNLLFVIGAFSVISLLVFLCQTFYNNKVWVQCIVVRMKIILKKH